MGRWPEIFAHYNLPPVDAKKHFPGECPLCSGKGKFRVDDKDGEGTWICVCDNGNGWDLLKKFTGKEFRTLAREIDKLLGNEWAHEKREPTQKLDKVLQVKTRFLSLPNLRNTPGMEYLHGRGIYRMPQRGVRFSRGEFDNDAGRSVPCMFSVASNEYGEAVYLHLTYIEDGKKADVPIQRKMRTLQEYQGSVAVKLQEPTNVLGIAEGIETALSAGFIYQLPTWSTLNATLMKRFKAPTGVEDLYIFADNDKNGTGLAAALECGNKNILSNNDVKNVVIRWPGAVNDFNDIITVGDEVLEWVLTK